MNRIFLDLEMNPIHKSDKEARKLCSREVIEFGAVCLDKDNKEVGTFQRYVKPEYNPKITRYIQKLTGITQAHVEGAASFPVVFSEFIDWCGDDYELYTWSDSDLIQLRKEATAKNCNQAIRTTYLYSHWKDLQKEFGDLLFLEKKSSLKNAASNADIAFLGCEHSALGDALTAAELFKEMEQGQTLKKVRKMLSDAREPIGTSLGQLIEQIA